jgi:hypothetical protein
MAAPLDELGYAAEGYTGLDTRAEYSFWQTAEETPELVWPLCIPIYRRMRRQDAQITSVLRAVTLPVRRTGWWIDPAGARPEVVEHISTDLNLPVRGSEPLPTRRRGRFSWAEHLGTALLCLQYGHQFFEVAYRVDDGGLYHIRKLGPRPPETISEIMVARDGGLVAIKQAGVGRDMGQVRIPVERLVAYVLDREGADWTGNSLLRPAYKHWLIKDRLLRVQAQTIERNGMGVPIYEGGPNDGPDDLLRGKAIAQSYKSSAASGAALPHEAKLRLLGVEGNLPDANPAIRYHDEQIGRAVLAHFLNLGTQTGSWALGTTFADFFVLSLQTVGEMIRDTAQAHIVEDLVDANWGPDEPTPQLVFDPIGSQKDAVAGALKTLVDAGILFPDRSLEEAVRQDYGLPPKDAPPPAQNRRTDDMPRWVHEGWAKSEQQHDQLKRLATSAPRPARARIEPDGALTLF